MGESTQMRDEREAAGAAVRVMAWRGSDEELLALVRRGGAGAGAALYDRFGDDINRLVWRVMGADRDHDDLVQQVFVNVLANVHKVRDPSALRSWVVSVTVNTARSEIRRRKFRRVFSAGAEEVPDVAAPSEDLEGKHLLGHTYRILDRLPADERIAFVLRHVEQHALTEVASMCGCSLATIKRRIARADKRFAELAADVPELAERMKDHRRWRKHDVV